MSRSIPFVAIVFIASACLERSTMVCSSGIICPPDSRCSADGKSCDSNLCGNGTLDPGEVCDDGNNFNVDPLTAVADECSADCQSTQVCGNGVFDPFVPGEHCDNGNLLGLDGCSGSCQLLRGRWEKLGATPSPRASAAMAYDAGRGRLVLFGGSTSPERSNETWEWDGVRWIELTPSSGGPSARNGHAMVYDAKRRRVLIFGGADGSSTLAPGTWEWNGASWTQIGLDSAEPPARILHAMAFDAGRGQTVLFGGLAATGDIFGDTWVLSDSGWRQLESLTTNPGSRHAHAMAYDPKRDRVVLFGGTSSSDVLADTWEFDGVSWIELTPAEGSPLPRRGARMSYHPERERVVLYGGREAGQVFNDLWEWDGSSWTEVTSAMPPPRSQPAFAYDFATRSLAVFGGLDDLTPLGDHWTLTDSEWLQLGTPTSPAPRQGHSISFDSARARAVLFGGHSDAYLQDTWEWGPTGWQQQTPTGAVPPARWAHGTAYDARREQVVLFGGASPGIAYGDTWTWDGSAWSDATPESPGGSPTPRSGHALAYDAERDRVVLFGGYDESVLGDTWEWDGISWQQVASSGGGPSARANHAMAYDPIGRQVLLFGGSVGAVELEDTWAWDGTTWSNITPEDVLASPPARSTHAMSADANSGRVILFGGRAATRLDDLWDWDGRGWSEVIADDRPGSRDLHAMTYDPVTGRTILFGGYKGTAFVGDTWFYSRRAVGPEECATGIDSDNDGLVGCQDPDCWGTCLASCPPKSTTRAWPDDCDPDVVLCGNGVCDELESYRLCPSDCPVSSPLCGDYHCDDAESATSCPGDCRT